jgi:hypothetical protein
MATEVVAKLVKETARKVRFDFKAKGDYVDGSVYVRKDKMPKLAEGEAPLESITLTIGI